MYIIRNIKVFIIFIYSLCFYASVCMDSAFRTQLEHAIMGRAPLRIVTLTRSTKDVDDRGNRYPPISATEATMVFAIVNSFLGDERDYIQQIEQAYSFDEQNFTKIKTAFNEFNTDQKSNEFLKEEIKKIKIRDNLKDEIASLISRKEVVPIAVCTKLEEYEHQGKVFMLDEKLVNTGVVFSIKRGITSEAFLKLLLPANNPELPPSLQGGKVKGRVYCVFSKEEISFKNMQEIRQLEQLFAQKEDLIKKECLGNNPFLTGYLSIKRQQIGYYMRIYHEAKGDLYKKAAKTPLVFVSNELFFGREFVFPVEYTLSIPSLPGNVLSCINFLLCGVADAHEKTQGLPKGGDDWIYTNCPALKRSGENYFKNISRYKVGDKIVQEYVKASYFEECDQALNCGYVYIYGICSDISKENGMDNYTNLVSTQICYDLQIKARANQIEHTIPLHIFQSNTHDLIEVLSRLENPQIPSRADIPGKPRIVVHSDPIHQEAFVSYPKRSFMFSDKGVTEENTEDYALAHPSQSLSFSIDKERYRDIYTLTEWILYPKD